MRSDRLSASFFINLIADDEVEMAHEFVQKMMTGKPDEFKNSFCSLLLKEFEDSLPKGGLLFGIDLVPASKALAYVIEHLRPEGLQERLWQLIFPKNTTLYAGNEQAYRLLADLLVEDKAHLATSLALGNLDLFDYLVERWGVEKIRMKLKVKIHEHRFHMEWSGRDRRVPVLIPTPLTKFFVDQATLKGMLKRCYEFGLSNILMDGGKLRRYNMSMVYSHESYDDICTLEKRFCPPPVVNDLEGTVCNPEYVFAAEALLMSNPEYGDLIDSVPCFVRKEFAAKTGAMFFRRSTRQCSEDVDLGFEADHDMYNPDGNPLSPKVVSERELIKHAMDGISDLGLECPEGYGIAMIPLAFLDGMRLDAPREERFQNAYFNMDSSIHFYQIYAKTRHSHEHVTTIMGRHIGYFGASYSNFYHSGEDQVVALIEQGVDLKGRIHELGVLAAYPYNPSMAVINHHLIPDGGKNVGATMNISGTGSDILRDVERMVAHGIPKDKYNIKLSSLSGADDDRYAAIKALLKVADWPFHCKKPSSINELIDLVDNSFGISELTRFIYYSLLSMQDMKELLNVVKTSEEVDALSRFFGAEVISSSVKEHNIKNGVVLGGVIDNEFSI